MPFMMNWTAMTSKVTKTATVPNGPMTVMIELIAIKANAMTAKVHNHLRQSFVNAPFGY